MTHPAFRLRRSHIRFFTLAWMAAATACGEAKESTDIPGGSGPDAGPAGSGGVSGSSNVTGGQGGLSGDGRSCELEAAPRWLGQAMSGVFARFDSDSRADFVASQTACCAQTNADRQEVYLFKGAADGAVDELATLQFPEGYVSARPVDLDADGLSDLVVLTGGAEPYTAPQPRALNALLNDGAGSFQPLPPRDVAALGAFLGARDFNADGFADLAFNGSVPSSEPTRSRVSVLLGDGEGGFGEPIVTDLPAIASALPAAPALGASDLLLDGRLLHSVGDGSFEATALPAGAQSLSMADVNRDGVPDFVLGRDSHVSLFVTSSDGEVPATPTHELEVPAAAVAGLAPDAHVVNLPFGDFDADGHLDTAVGSWTQAPLKGMVTVYFGREDGSMSEAWTRELTVGASALYRPSQLLAGDIDGDGASDLLVNGYAGTDRANIGFFSVRCGD